MNSLANNWGINLEVEVGILTKREIEIVQGSILPDKELAYNLNMSYFTLLSHLKNIRNKTGLQGGKELVYFGMKKGLIN
ncbi:MULTISPECIES: helix-turn-helix transcriptional regulator [unclassified Pedobacter]|uniref:helix-turn-helix transcriptional regulator n=1 Tax=unclassified Pedobacter TaxID=2628915 RepID=UPI0014220E29|nr:MULTISPECIES: helix-turn-helix transcriptional regulator [unclassified Pedobacter]NII81685.1 DNA-binding CsgD family transcriptional regulator [Pedobacter sp. SG908]NMN35689.1 DNA-binding CsgD family transcriptional regulator [Pedobacter sp. SG918]